MRNKRVILTAIIGFVLFASYVAGASDDAEDKNSPVGVWRTVDDETGKAKSHIRIWKKSGKLYGKITKLINPDEPNPVCDECSGKRHNKPIIGMLIMRGLYKDGNEWTGGTILDPANGKNYKVTIEVKSGGKKLKVRGYVGISMLGRTQHWYRIK